MSLLQEIEPIKTRDFLQDKFREYYGTAKITLPPRFTAREWGFLNWGGGIMNRHVKFSTTSEINKRELIVLVTPKILNDTGSNIDKFNFRFR